MANPSFAIVDDDATFCGLAAEIATDYGFDARGMHSVSEAKKWLANHSPDLMLLDVRLPDGSGYEVLDTLGARHKGRVVMVSGSADVSEAARAVSSHASDYWLKPLHTGRLLELLRSVASSYQARQGSVPDALGLVGASMAMTRLRTDIRRAAASNMNVMLFGEAGTGKAMVANAIHSASNAPGSLVTVNCCAEDSGLAVSFESLADAYKRARGGTLYLQDIDLLQPDAQRQLGSFIRRSQSDAGAGTSIFTRLVASTGEPMEVAASLMHAGLFYRIYEHGIHLPPLRERGQDLGLLAQHFTDQYNAHSGESKRLGRISESVKSYAWPGNVRELATVVRQAHAGSESEDVLLRIPRNSASRSAASEAGPDLAVKRAGSDEDCVVILVGTQMREVEQLMLEATLRRCNGDKTAASRVLGVSTRTVHNWFRRRSGEDPDYPN